MYSAFVDADGAREAARGTTEVEEGKLHLIHEPVVRGPECSRAD